MSSFFLFDRVRFKGQHIALVTHSHADVDAVASAIALYFYFKSFADPEIIIPDHVNLPARHLLDWLKVPFTLNPSNVHADAVLLLEVRSWDRLGSLEPLLGAFPNPMFLLDHHEPSQDHLVLPKHSYIDSHAISLTELLYALFSKYRIRLSSIQATALAIGLLADSATFLHASTFTFQAMHDLLVQSKHTYTELQCFLSESKDIGQRIAALKTLHSFRIYRASDYIAVTAVHGLGSDVEETLIALGADIIVLAATEDRTVHVSMRASSHIQSQLSLHLVLDIIQPLQSKYSIQGGGHSGAASFSCPQLNSTQILAHCLDLMLKKIRQRDSHAKWKEYVG